MLPDAEKSFMTALVSSSSGSSSSFNVRFCTFVEVKDASILPPLNNSHILSLKEVFMSHSWFA